MRAILSTIGLATLCATSSAIAEEENQIILKAIDGSVEIHGHLLERTDTHYIIKTDFFDALQVKADAVTCSGYGCDTNTPNDEASQFVKLVSLDGSYSIEGDLVSYEEGRYILRTELGNMQLNSQLFRCEGTVCPDVEFYDPTFSIWASDKTTNHLLPEMLKGYANASNLEYRSVLDEDQNRLVKLINRNDGSVVAEVSLFVRTADTALDEAYGDQEGFAIVANKADGQTSNFSEGRFDLNLPVALDAKVIIVGDENPIRDLDNVEMNEIWSGRMETWESIGGGDRRVMRHLLASAADELEGTYEGIWPVGGNAYDPQVITHQSIEAMIAAVRNDPTAIGIVDRSDAIRAGAEMVGTRKECGLIAQPSDFDIRIRNYPYSSTLQAYANVENLHPVARDFLEWSQSNRAQSSVTDAGFTSASLQRMGIQDMGVALIHNAAVEPDFRGDQFADMMRELRFADRLSFTFRFAYGSSRLDAVSEESAKELVLRLRDSQFEGLEILLVGFADSVGNPDTNTELALRRAQEVQAVLEQELGEAAANRVNIQTLSFGEQMPLDCNATEEGRASNRRVEVWVRTIDGGDLPPEI